MFERIFTHCHSSVLFFIFMQSLSGFDPTCNTCGQMGFNVEQGVQDRFLDDGRKLTTKIVKSDSQCFVECSLDCRCMSFSVCDNSCQLNAGSRKLMKHSLQFMLGCRYYDFPPFESTCDASLSPPRLCCLPSSPFCYNGATCVVNITDTTRRFKCLCPSGYYGNQCQVKDPKTCLDYWTDQVKPFSGRYNIVVSTGISFEVFCDFDSEKGVAWTLFESFDVDNMIQLNEKPFTKDCPQNEHDLNWKLFRLPKFVMSEISYRSTFWRATCSYSLYGVDFRDYIRVRLSIMNPLTYDSLSSKCLIVDYFDIKGTNCVNCTQVFIQTNDQMLNLKPRYNRVYWHCNFDSSMVEYPCSPSGHSRLLGGYKMTCLDPKHRCSEKTTSTTEFWFGAVKKNNGN